MRGKEFVDQFLIKHEFIKRIHQRFAKEGIVIPYPIRALNYDQEKRGSGVYRPSNKWILEKVMDIWTSVILGIVKILPNSFPSLLRVISSWPANSLGWKKQIL